MPTSELVSAWDFSFPGRYVKKKPRNKLREKSSKDQRIRFNSKVPFHKKADTVDELSWAMDQSDLLGGPVGPQNSGSASNNVNNRGGSNGRGSGRGGRNNRGNRGGRGGNSNGSGSSNRGTRHASVPDSLADKLCSRHYTHADQAWYCLAPMTCPWKNKCVSRPDQ